MTSNYWLNANILPLKANRSSCQENRRLTREKVTPRGTYGYGFKISGVDQKA